MQTNLRKSHKDDHNYKTILKLLWSIRRKFFLLVVLCQSCVKMDFFDKCHQWNLSAWFSKMPTTFNRVSFNANDEITRKEIVNCQVVFINKDSWTYDIRPCDCSLSREHLNHLKSFFHILGAGRLQQEPPALLIFLPSFQFADDRNAEKRLVIVVSCYSYCSHCNHNFGKMMFTCT